MVPSGLGSSFKNFIASTVDGKGTGQSGGGSSNGDVFSKKHHGILGGQIQESVNTCMANYRCENLMYILFLVI